MVPPPPHTHTHTHSQQCAHQVALQHEFTRLGIIAILEGMESDAAEELREQIEAYQDNFLNVAELAHEAELHEQDLEVCPFRHHCAFTVPLLLRP
jgi:hypothetical protein